ncbi:hypothetical protein SEA_SOILDRAGON_85 [Mycobacterium phage SoilDragon]|uniref:Uncharacterized protein n=3 Tax=Microwolfvirus TaxID=2942894 RepID=A0A345M499_9CAUD|nr:hypothetical protein M611_gp14 [Mycobacterium phage Jobu08]YP_010060126.1 hypothetical protein KIJ58_gp15 [Mycobacterium phage SoilDragon]AXH65320.1 hypothetical protein SEA_BRESAM8_85 [Mycobacterium phage BreSam8]AXQ64250.1 hypothetical protein SEA_MADMARIE_83 [Mycobacterium phage MadMarie]AGM61600.1 hypothetical protein PBI_JOBU08_81 [Mycobacterium phage Jobu08]QDP45383.1 hypothetical protein SEA_SOILDRAGON_85 [Mycobacterium phage SoilDragon]
MAVIEAKHYEETRQRLTKDPIVIALSEEIRGLPREQMVHEDSDTPRFEFMQAANREYRRRGGTDGGHIGAIAEAIIRILDA